MELMAFGLIQLYINGPENTVHVQDDGYALKKIVYVIIILDTINRVLGPFASILGMISLKISVLLRTKFRRVSSGF
jgi:hypothetical protein